MKIIRSDTSRTIKRKAKRVFRHYAGEGEAGGVIPHQSTRHKCLCIHRCRHYIPLYRGSIGTYHIYIFGSEWTTSDRARSMRPSALRCCCAILPSTCGACERIATASAHSCPYSRGRARLALLSRYDFFGNSALYTPFGFNEPIPGRIHAPVLACVFLG